MPAVLTHKSIMLLARKRVQEIGEALEAKRLAAAAPLTNLEERLEYLAKQAFFYMSTHPSPKTSFPLAPFSRPFGKDVSMFAVMGCMGPDIPAFSEALRPGQAWVFDNVHKGYPDDNREAVVADTCDFIFEFWRQASKAITAEVKDPSIQLQRLNFMRAYVLGHLCHMAADVLSHPFINAIEWRTATAAQSKLSHADGEASHDALVARKIFLRKSTRAGEEWDAWWPELDEVPSQFFAAYSAAMDATYDALRNRRNGLKDFEVKLAAMDPPQPVPDFFKDGYSLYRNGIVGLVYHNTQFNWLILLSGVWGSIAAAPVLATIFFPTIRGFFGERREDGSDQDFKGLVSLGFAMGSFVALGYSIFAFLLTRRGVLGQSVYGILGNAVVSALGLGVIVALAKGASSENTSFYSLFLVVISTVVFVQLVLFLVYNKKTGSGRRSKLALAMSVLVLVPAIGTLLAAGAFFLLRLIPGLSDRLVFFLGAVLWLLGLGALGLWVVAKKVRDAQIRESPKAVAERRHFVRLFDDTTLYRDLIDPRIKGTGLAKQFFPAGRRELLKIWWEGPGPLFVRVDRYRLVFSFVNNSTAQDQVVQAPIAPMHLFEFINELNRLVKGPGGEVEKLKAQFVNAGDLDYELPPGATFADHGDAKSDEEEREKAAKEFQRIGNTPDTAYILEHAPKPAQSVHFGAKGPVNADGLKADQIQKIADTDGYPYVFDPTSDDDQSVMGFAGDLGALLCMGAVTHLETGVAEADKVYQVFRNWSFDRRRVNEWRMLVAGGAVSEKAGHSDKWDSAMLKPPDPATWINRLPVDIARQAEQTALSMGWVPLLRAFVDMSRQPNASALSPDRLRPEYPGNIAISRAMAFLFDLPEPAAVKGQP